ncbi:MAG TPA: hypothetical protein VN032_01040 [Thermoanaerobaculia bacterium]|nr:hypothetical protein [Thermoanaerobaculia bacterium]
MTVFMVRIGGDTPTREAVTVVGLTTLAPGVGCCAAISAPDETKSSTTATETIDAKRRFAELRYMQSSVFW